VRAFFLRSNYQPMNAPKSLEEIKNDPCQGINSLDHWTPLKEDDGTVQEFNVPYMPFVTPFALNRQTSPPPLSCSLSLFSISLFVLSFVPLC
jgi:hypothetical protein